MLNDTSAQSTGPRHPSPAQIDAAVATTERPTVAPPHTKCSAAFRQIFANNQPSLLIVPSILWRSVAPSQTTTMPKRGRRGGGSISRHKRGELKKLSTVHLHPTSVLYAPSQNESDVGTTERSRGNEQGQEKKIKVSNLVRTNKRLKEVNSELVSEKKDAKKRAAEHKEKAASLLREKDAEASLQKKIGKHEIQSKAMLRDCGKLTALVPEKDKSNLQNKNIKAERGSGWGKS